jgi:hypothetical protein
MIINRGQCQRSLSKDMINLSITLLLVKYNGSDEKDNHIPCWGGVVRKANVCVEVG